MFFLILIVLLILGIIFTAKGSARGLGVVFCIFAVLAILAFLFSRHSFWVVI